MNPASSVAKLGRGVISLVSLGNSAGSDVNQNPNRIKVHDGLEPRDLVNLKVKLHQTLLSKLDLASLNVAEPEGKSSDIRTFLTQALKG